ncbi:MAG: hypothetical protein FGM46_04325 [Ferruginibacter sp.]|nr:hypothetical protein [Ferruginibacter sp.]
MQVITDMYEIKNCRTVFTENFSDNNRKWEIVDIESEKAEIKSGYYHMENSSVKNWKYYKTKTGLKENDDFVIDAIIELNKKEDEYRHFGLVWGFDQKREYLNRFTLSADGRRAVIMQFERNHHIVFHRFHARKFPRVDTNKPVRFTIIKLGEYFHLLLNEKKIYMAHALSFCNLGSFAGYYIEPQLSVKSNFFQVKKMKVQSVTSNGLMELIG